MPDLQSTYEAAKRLGIKMTNAEEGSELYQAWAHRVYGAHCCDERARIARESGQLHLSYISMEARERLSREADAYAI